MVTCGRTGPAGVVGNPTGVLRRARIRWHLASPVLRVAAQGGLVAALAVAGFTVLSTGREINETAASVLIAVVFGVATVLQLRQSQRRQHTVELITVFQSSEALATADTWMAARIASHQPVEPDVPPDHERHVITLLDYYEFLSSLALRGLVDVPLLLSLRGGTMTRCYRICRRYVDDRRSNVGPELYHCFELFGAEYSRRARRGSRPAAAGRAPVGASQAPVDVPQAVD
jgi:hypothetical protein